MNKSKQQKLPICNDEADYDLEFLRYWYENALVCIYSIDVERGMVLIEDESTEGACVSGAGYYLPGSPYSLTPDVEEGYELIEFTVNGEAVEDGCFADVEKTSGATIKAVAQVRAIEAEEQQEIPEEETTNSNQSHPADTSRDEKQDTPQTSDSNEVEKTTVPQTITPETPGTVTPESSKQSQTVKKGDVVTKSNVKFKVTNSSARKVSVVGITDQKAKTISIPNTITIKGKKYKVTAIGNNAFKNCKKLSKLVIRKNITKVGKNVFKGCKKLKKITFKSTKKKIRKKLNKQLVARA